MRALGFGVILCLASAACTGGVREASVAQHERDADADDRRAQGHEDQFDPAASTRGCFRSAGRRVERSAICWTSVRNPTAVHLSAAEGYRRRAAAHRAASAALRDAEARACSEVSPDDRDTSPFERAEDIVDVWPLRSVRHGPGRGLGGVRVSGAVVRFRAVEGLTVESLQRVVDCHLARNAALGHVVPDLPNCPLVPKGVRARVSSAGAGFLVTIRTRDPGVAREVYARSRRLLPAGSN